MFHHIVPSRLPTFQDGSAGIEWIGWMDSSPRSDPDLRFTQPCSGAPPDEARDEAKDRDREISIADCTLPTCGEARFSR